LVVAVQNGFILPTSELDENLLIQDYKFLHDRVQQAAYTLIADSDKKSVHLKIGRLLQLNMSETEQEEKIFDLVEHFNIGRDLITEQTEKIALAKFNLIAACKAKDSTAYLAAREYLTIGISLLSGDFWQEEYQLTLELHKERAEIEYLNSNFAHAEELIYLVIEKCKTNVEKAVMYKLLIVMLTMMSKYESAINAARESLNLFAIELPDQDFANALQYELAEVRKLWQPGKIHTLVEQPEMTNMEMRAALTLLVCADPPAYFSNPELFGIIAAKMAYVCLRYGSIAVSAKAYATYAIVLSSILEEYRSGYEFARLGLSISERFNDSSMKARVANNLNHIQHWVLPIKEAEVINNEGYQACLESGELQFAGYISFHQIVNFFASGKIFSEIFAVLNDYLKFADKTKNLLAYHTIIACQLPIYNLSGLSPKPREFASKSLSEADYLEDCQTHQNFFALANYLTYKAQVFYLYGDNVTALDCIQSAEKMLVYVRGMITNAINNFYNSLILIALYPTLDESEQIPYQQKIETNQKQMKIWADNCPENFLHKYLLVEAEMARISGKEMEVILDFYDRAIASAQQNDYIQEEALGNELAAKFWLEKGKVEIAKPYMKKAHYGYQLWGAKCKVEDLEQKYPQLLSKKSGKKTANLGITVTSTATSTTGGSSDLDFATVIKASQVLAGEIALDKLLAKLMRILMENGGAEKGFLLLSNQGKLTIEATGDVGVEPVQISQSIAVEDCENLPLGVVQYVARTLEDVVLSDATNEGVFTKESYIVKKQPKSILCAPIINQGKLIGLLYLENNLTTGAFTRDRLEILKVLSSQAAISIENALLYRTLEDKVQERTAQLAEANQEISTLNEKLQEENLRLSAELDVAKKLQEMVLPKPEELGDIVGLDIAGYMEPADEVGGDYYDVLSSENGVKIAIGDVTGHGLESGVLMLMAQTAVRTLNESNETDPVRFLDILNRTLYGNIERMNSSKNMTLAIIDYADGMVKLSGQHEEMIVVRADGTIEEIDTLNLGFPIGLDGDIVDFIAQTTVTLNREDVVILYTDGITEAENIDRQLYGLAKLCQIVVENRGLSAQEIRQCVIDDVRQFIGKQKVFDDITLVVLKQK
ncbi:MAG: SpoIIE family protein phosphatase, partial [Microcoleaceae cyanobacterium]